MILVVEIKGDEEISKPSDENKGKYKAAKKYFEIVNEYQSNLTYSFNFLTPRDYELYFEQMRQSKGKNFHFTSNVDAALEENRSK